MAIFPETSNVVEGGKARIIGEICRGSACMVVRNTQIFGTRVIDMLVGDPGGRTCVGHGETCRLVTEQTPSMRLNVPGRFDPPHAVECSYVSDNHRIVRT